MSRRLIMLVVAFSFLLLGSRAALADHVPTNLGSPVGFPADDPSLKIGDWRFVKNFPAGPGAVTPLGVDWDTFTRDGRRYFVASSMTMGLTVIDVTEPLNPPGSPTTPRHSGAPRPSRRSLPRSPRARP